VSKASIDAVQALRGIAALAVVFWHASRYLGPYGSGIGGLVFAPGAAMGVDLFFLISGFIMFHTTRNSDGSWRAFADFAIKRAARIWPVWIIALICYLLLRIDASYFTDPVKLGWLAHSLLLIPTAGAPSDVPPVYGVPVLGVGWTLNYEMYFYAFFGLAMLCGRWRWPAFVAWLVATLVLIPLATGRLDQASGAWIILEPSNGYAFANRYLGLMTNGLILLFAAGVAIGAIYHSRWAIANVLLLRILAVAAVGAVLLQYALHFHAWHGIGHWGLSLTPLLLVVLMLHKSENIRLPRWLIYLGDISFSLYLLHPTIQEGFDVVLGGVLPNFLRTGFTALIVTTLLSILAAAASYHILERGLCEYVRRRLRHWVLGKPDDTAVALPKPA